MERLIEVLILLFTVIVLTLPYIIMLSGFIMLIYNCVFAENPGIISYLISVGIILGGFWIKRHF